MVEPHSIKTFPGLCASRNTIGDAQEGSADIMDDMVLRKKNTPEPRPGGKASAATTGPINALAFKEGQAIALIYDTPSSTGTLCAYNPATNAWTTLPMTPGGLTMDRPGISGAHTRFVSANKALYFQSKYGLTKIETLASGVSKPAVQPPPIVHRAAIAGNNGPGIEIVTAAWGGPNFLKNGNNTAYRFTLARFGANNELIESEPSEQVITTDHGAADQNVAITPSYYWMVPADAFMRSWRAKQVLAANDVQPEFFLVLESPPSSVIAANGFLGLNTAGSLPVDVADDSTLIVPLYTNPASGSGAASANASAPLSFDVAWFKNRMHYLNTSDVQRVTIRVIGTGTGGIADGDSILINGVRLKFSTSAAANDMTRVLLYTGGTVAQNIENTARDLVERINWNFLTRAGNYTIYPDIPGSVMAQYVAIGATDIGTILIRSVLPGSQAITVTTSSATGWDRNYTAGKASDPNAQAAGWSWSNISQPEGVPTLNNNPIGDRTAAGQRLIALKETMFALKQDGLWKITDDGSALGPQLQLMDPTVRLVAPESAVALDNFILALADQGIILVTETGAVLNITHTQIEQELFKLMAYVGSARLAETAFGVANQSVHEYILALPESPNATSCSIQYVYNMQTQTWVRWRIPNLTSGSVNPDTGQLYFGRSDGTLWIERKARDNTDFQDPGFTIASPTATQTASLVFSGDLRTGATPFAVGDIVQQWQAVKALAQRVIAVSYSSTNNQTTVTLDKAPPTAWNQSVNLTIVKAIQSTIRLLPIHAGEPLTDKNWDNCYTSFRYCDLDFMQVGYASEKYPITSTAIERINNADGSSNAPVQLETWGSKAWGAAIWGKQAKDIIIKCTMPQEFDHSAQLTLTLGLPCALQRFELNAIDVKIAGASDRVVR